MPNWLRPSRADNAAGRPSCPTPNGLPMAGTWSPTASSVRVAQHDHRQLVHFDLEDGQVGLGVGADGAGACAAAVREGDVDFVGALDHVVVGQNVTVLADDDAAAQPAWAWLPWSPRRTGTRGRCCVGRERLPCWC